VQIFSFAYSDPYGNADIAYVDFMIQTAVNGQNACYAFYVPSTNVLTMFNDAGSGYAGSSTLGTAGTLTNSQCTIDVGASSASAVGNNLTLTVALTFKPGFAGAKNSYLIAANNGGISSGWQSKGTWTVVTAPPVNASVSPASGSGAVQTFSFVYSDPYGYADIAYVDFMIESALNGQNACYAFYVPSTNILTMFNDAGNGYTGSSTLGTVGTLSNSQCTIDVGASSASAVGNNLTLTVAVTFKPGFAGAKNSYMMAANKSGLSSGWQSKGTWTVVAAPPVDVSVSPASGSGAVQIFSFAYSDPYGYADIAYVDFMIQTAVNGQNACYAFYVPSTNILTMFNDAGNGYTGSGTLGTVGTLTNSQCTIDVGASSAVATGNNLTLTVALTFKPGFTGAKNSYMIVVNNSGLSSGWQSKGTWTTP
jgi:hypothetical protein